jgi:hypothetical protein
MGKRLRFMTGLIAPLKVEPGSEVTLRSRWPKVWKHAKAKKLRRWL